MVTKTDRVPDDRWLSTLARWLEEGRELLLAFTPAGCGGATGYLFCRTLDEAKGAVDRHSAAARIIAYRRHSLTVRGVVTDAFIEAAMAQIPENRAFMLIRTSLRQYDGFCFGLSGHHGRNHEELEEYLQDHRGEEVRLGGDPHSENGEDSVLVVYKDGLIGAY